MNDINIELTPQYKLSPYLFMQFAEPLGTTDSSIDAAWDFISDTWQPKALDIVRRLAPPMLRWGGCFSAYYHWREAVGPMSQRIPMLNYCWDGVFLNHVGTAEIAELAKAGNSEMLFCINYEGEGNKGWPYPAPAPDRLGDAEEAADWIRYCNDPDDKLRISHGNRTPFNVKYWQIGNETGYHPGMTSKENGIKAKEFIRAMRNADPSIKVIVWGDGPNEVWEQRYKDGLTSDWTRDVCESVGDTAELVAFHNHFAAGRHYTPLHGVQYQKDPDLTWLRLFEAVDDFEKRILYMEKSVAPYGRKLAITESHFVLEGRHRGDMLSSWYAGVAYAKCANILQRHGRTIDIATLADFMGNRWQNNAIMLPTPMWSEKPAYFLPVGTIMKLYSHHIGQDALKATTVDHVDAAASRTENKVFLHLVNTSRTNATVLHFTVNGKEMKPSCILEIAHLPDTEICDTCPDIFEPENVPVADTYTLPAAGVAVVEFSIENVKG